MGYSQAAETGEGGGGNVLISEKSLRKVHGGRTCFVRPHRRVSHSGPSMAQGGTVGCLTGITHYGVLLTGANSPAPDRPIKLLLLLLLLWAGIAQSVQKLVTG